MVAIVRCPTFLISISRRLHLPSLLLPPRPPRRRLVHRWGAARQQVRFRFMAKHRFERFFFVFFENLFCINYVQQAIIAFSMIFKLYKKHQKWTNSLTIFRLPKGVIRSLRINPGFSYNYYKVKEKYSA